MPISSGENGYYFAVFHKASSDFTLTESLDDEIHTVQEADGLKAAGIWLFVLNNRGYTRDEKR